MPVAPMAETNDTCSELGGTMEPTQADAALRTYRADSPAGDWTRRNPWRAPGFAPVFSACGLAGGGATPGDWLSDSLTEVRRDARLPLYRPSRHGHGAPTRRRRATISPPFPRPLAWMDGPSTCGAAP